MTYARSTSTFLQRPHSQGAQSINKSEDPRNETLWTAIFQTRYWYIGIFALIASYGEVVVVIGVLNEQQGIIEMSRAAFRESADVMGTSAGAAFGLTEVGKGLMVLAHGIKKWFERKAEERDNKLRAEGRKENQQLWIDWNSRRKAAEARGEEFTEPPPNGKV